MKRAVRYSAITVGTAAWLIFVTANIALAQNFSNVVGVDSATSVNNELKGTGDDFANVSLVPAGPARNTSLRNSYGVPEFNEDSSNYTLGKEDVIDIIVARHPEVSGTYIINSEGKIQYEFIGDITIGGMKKGEVKTLLAERLSEYIITPDVTVKIIGYNSKIVYVVGEVGNPGQ